jgi:hypothetical protein
MEFVDAIDVTIPLPVLATCRPNRTDRLTLKLVDCPVSIPVTRPDLMPVVCLIGKPDMGSNYGQFERHGHDLELDNRTTIRHDGERYFQEAGLSVNTFFNRLKSDPFPRIGQSNLLSNTLRQRITETPRQKFHPATIPGFFSPTSRAQYAPLTDLFKETAALALTPEGEMEVEIAVKAVQEVISTLVAVGDKLYVKCGQPIYMVQVPPPGGRGTVTIRTIDSDFWTGGRRTTIEAMNAPSTRFYRADAIGEILEKYPDRYNFIEIGVSDDFSPAFPLETLEFDRIARALCTDAGHMLSNGDRMFSIDRSVVERWLDFRDLLGSYNPLAQEIPGEVESMFEEIVSSFDIMGQMPAVRPEDIAYAREMWTNRPVDDWLPQPGRRLSAK